MKVYLMRHCLTDEGPQMDPDRTLNEVGEGQAHAIRKFLKLAEVSPDVILSSDFARAEDTAKILQRGDTPIKTTPFLRPDGDGSDTSKAVANAWKSILKLADDAKSVLVVTHSPLIQPLLAAVAFNFVDEKWIWEHGAIAYVNTHESRFRWFVSPKLAAHLTGAEIPKEVENPVGESADFARGALMLSENLRKAYRAAVVDPLIDSLKTATAERFRKQKVRVLRAVNGFKNQWSEENYIPLRMAIQSALPDPSRRFDRKYTSATWNARAFGAQHAREQVLGIIREAKNEPAPIPQIGLPKRTTQDLTGELDATTDKEIGNTLKNAFDPGSPMSIAAALDALRQQFEQYSDGVNGQTSRAETVAATEVSNAYHGGGSDAVKLVPHTRDIEKQWAVEDNPCPTCEANAAMGWILADQPFDSGDDSPPNHPNCRCSVDYRSSEPEVAE